MRLTTQNRNIILLLLLVHGIFVAILFANAFGVPFTSAQLHSSLIYWVHALTALAVVVLMLGLGTLLNMTHMMLTVLFGALVIWILVHIFIFVMLVLELVSCDTSIQCAGNVVDLVFVGPYEGPSGTFLLNFIGCIVLLLLEVIIAYLVYSQRRSARMMMMAQCAASSSTGYGYAQQQYPAQQQQYATTGYGYAQPQQTGWVGAKVSDDNDFIVP